MEYNLTLEKILWDNFALVKEAQNHFQNNLPISGMEFYNLANKNYKVIKNKHYYSPTMFAYESYQEYVFEKYIDKHTGITNGN